jgi:hypothetical protein
MAHVNESNKNQREPFEAFGVFFAWTVGLIVACVSAFFFLIVAGDLYTGHTPSNSFMAWEFLFIWALAPLGFLYILKRSIFG